MNALAVKLDTILIKPQVIVLKLLLLIHVLTTNILIRKENKLNKALLDAKKYVLLVLMVITSTKKTFA